MRRTAVRSGAGPGRGRRARGALVVALAILGVAMPGRLRAQSWLVVVTGLPGTPVHDSLFHSEAATLIATARTRLGISDERIIRLGGADATAQAVVRALTDVAARARAGDVVAVVLIGHGSALGGPARLNLPGPDLTAAQLAPALARFAGQELVVVNTSSASGPWAEALAGPRRTIITATRSAAERDETVFARYFAEVFGREDADTDKDGRVSVLEAFESTRAAVERHYTAARRLRTEHALLESDGDGRGSLTPAADADGRRAALLFLDVARGAGSDSTLARLVAHRDSLQRVLGELQARRAAMADSAAYGRELERLLLELAQAGRAVRERQGVRP